MAGHAVEVVPRGDARGHRPVHADGAAPVRVEEVGARGLHALREGVAVAEAARHVARVRRGAEALQLRALRAVLRDLLLSCN